MQVSEGEAGERLLVRRVLPPHLPGLETPEPRHVVRAGGEEVLGVSREVQVPHPSLRLASELHDQREVLGPPDLDL